MAHDEDEDYGTVPYRKGDIVFVLSREGVRSLYPPDMTPQAGGFPDSPEDLPRHHYYGIVMGALLNDPRLLDRCMQVMAAIFHSGLDKNEERFAKVVDTLADPGLVALFEALEDPDIGDFLAWIEEITNMLKQPTAPTPEEMVRAIKSGAVYCNWLKGEG